MSSRPRNDRARPTHDLVEAARRAVKRLPDDDRRIRFAGAAILDVIQRNPGAAAFFADNPEDHPNVFIAVSADAELTRLLRAARAAWQATRPPPGCTAACEDTL